MDTGKTHFSIFPEGDNLADILSITQVERLVPSFYVYSRNGQVTQVEIEEEGILRIGNGEHCDVVLNDPAISDTQVSVIRIADECIFLDSGRNDIVHFNCVKCRQLIMPSESRVLMKIGSTWIAYIGIDYHVHNERDSTILRRSLYRANQEALGDILLQLEDLEWYSNESPVLIGSHSICDFKITGKNVKALHAIVYFSPEGVFIEDLTHGKPGIQINDTPVIGMHPVTGDLTITIGGVKIFLYVYDDIQGQCKQVFAALNRTPPLVLKDLQNPDAPPVVLEVTRQKLSVGRGEGNDITFVDPSVSRKHAYIHPKGKYLHIMDNNSSNKTCINLEPVSKATAIPGDIISFGSMKFLLHYALS